MPAWRLPLPLIIGFKNKQMSNKPLDYQEPERKPEELNPEVARNRKLAFYLDIIPLTFLGLGVVLHQFGEPSWRVIFALGAILACAIYLISSWTLLWRKRYGRLEQVLSILSLIFFVVAGYIIYLQFFDLEMTYNLRQYTRWGGMGILGLTAIGFVYRIGDNYFSEYYRRLLTRLLVIVAILFKGFL